MKSSSNFIFAQDNNLALRQAAAGNKMAKVKEILADPAFKGINSRGEQSLQTALHRACANSHQEMALYLAIHGADIILADVHEKTPIDYCE
jgi:ankyrin repeat protein